MIFGGSYYNVTNTNNKCELHYKQAIMVEQAIVVEQEVAGQDMLQLGRVSVRCLVSEKNCL